MVLPNRATQLKAEVIQLANLALGRQRLAQTRYRARVESKRLIRAEHRAVELVTTALGGDVNDAAGGATKLRLVTAGDDVDFFDEVLRQLGPDDALVGVRGIEAVDDEVVLVTGRARDLHADVTTSSTGLATGVRGTWGQGNHTLERAATNRGVAQHFLVDFHAGAGAGGIDVGRGLFDDLDFALACRQPNRSVDRNGLAKAQADAGTNHAGLVVRAEVEADLVVIARRQLRDQVATTGVGDFRLELLQRRTVYDDGNGV